MSVEGRTHKPIVDHEACNSCSICFRACPAELAVGLRKDEESLCGLVYQGSKGKPTVAAELNRSLPPCQQACPINQDIRGYIRHIASGQFEEAMQVIQETNPLPLICGYVCHRPCEEVCLKHHLGKSAPVRALKRFVAENFDPRLPPEQTLPKNGIKIAIIGTGPAGLAAALELVQQGFEIEMYESHAEPGGMLQWAIPDFRLPREIIHKEVARLKALGVNIRTGIRFGDDLDYDSLKKSGSQAVILATGTMLGSKMQIANESNMPGLIDCLTYLHGFATGEAMDLGKQVLVIGGGNAALDTARTAKKAGTETVKILYRRSRAEMPAEKHEVDQALKEGVEIEYLTLPLEIRTSKGVATGLQCAKTKLIEDPKSKRLKPVPQPDSEFDIQADTIITAIGQLSDIEQVSKGLPFNPGWNSNKDVSDTTPCKNIPGLFAAGDFANGSSTVVEALASGKRTALGVMAYLQARKRVKRNREKATDKCRGLPNNQDTNLLKQTCRPFSLESSAGTVYDPIPDEETAIQLAQACLVSVTCNNCNLCLMFCPDLCITRNDRTGNVEIDEAYCKGCGICAYICPKQVIEMVRE